MTDFWIACGHHLLDRHAGGGLAVTDEFLKAYVARPELMPPDDACAVERALHRRLLADPRRAVGDDEVAAIADDDARENWRLVLALRDLLLRHPTLEAAYLAMVRSGAVDLPPLFVNQLVHVILRNALDGCEDPFELRAAELFFRPQRILPHEQALLLGDAEVTGADGAAPVLSLIGMLQDTTDVRLDVLTADNADSYWRRSDAFDMALDFSSGARGQAALAAVMRRWMAHLLGIEVTIEPIAGLHDAQFDWYVGLDAEATRIGDRLWRGKALDQRTAGRVLALFRLAMTGQDDALRQAPAYLLLATTSDQVVRMKPQNLLTGLPITHLEAVT